MTSPVTTSRSWWRRFVVDQLALADAERQVAPGRLSDRARVIAVYAVGSLVLIAMSYGVLNGANQDGMATAIVGLVRELDADLAATLQSHQRLLRTLMWTLGAFVMYFVLPALTVRVLFGHRLRDYGLNLRGFRRHFPLYLVLFVPVAGLVFAVAGTADFQAKYPLYHEPRGIADMLIWDLGYGLQFFSLEFFFRGFLVHGVKDRLGVAGVFAMIMPYVMIHFSKPLYETIGAVIAGSVLGVLSLRTRSIAGGVFIHTAVAWSMDLAALLHRDQPWAR